MKYILFDLDGTLTDPGEGITNSVAYALKCAGFEPPKDRTELYPFIGPPLMDSFAKYYGMSPEAGRKAVDDYREYFGEKGMLQNEKYEGIESVLETVNALGGRCVLATAKPLFYAEQILDYFDLSKYFYFKDGSTMAETRTKKYEVIEHIFETLGVKEEDKKDFLMVGDRDNDVLGARKCGIACVGVCYGYGSREELEGVNADYIVETIPQLKEFLEKYLD